MQNPHHSISAFLQIKVSVKKLLSMKKHAIEKALVRSNLNDGIALPSPAMIMAYHLI